MKNASKEMYTEQVCRTLKIRNWLQQKNFLNRQKYLKKKISFDFCSNDEYENKKKKLKSQYAKAKTIKGTCQFHSYKALQNGGLEYKVFFASTEGVIKKFNYFFTLFLNDM